MKRKFTCRPIKSSTIVGAEDTMDERLDNALSDLKDDFDYIISGLEKLGRNGANSSNSALAISETLSNNLQSVIDSIADAVTEQGE